MATYNKFQQTVEDWMEGVYTASSDQFVIALTTNGNAPVATNSVLANLTEIAYTNLSSRNITTSSSGQTTGTFTQLFTDLVLTASGAVATFRHVVIYDDTPTSPANPLLGHFDFGSDLTLASGETLTIDWTTSSWTVV
ncbi:MAG: hypothetical protein JKX85_12845 [Phycisphaeraceae bacterium]|nr:hypothetical protein [Phycisphaeraceae bacterium]